ncbi:MAG: RagB/SusD family nutrient uptake outer membrane protein [Butyricimonas faecalis]
MMPLIRMSELYLIAAECETDVQKALDNYFNPLRFSRNCVNQNAIDEDALKNLIRAEYVREFIGEDSCFYYKRNGLQNIPDGATVSSVKSMSLDGYVFPLPDGETSQRANWCMKFY